MGIGNKLTTIFEAFVLGTGLAYIGYNPFIGFYQVMYLALIGYAIIGLTYRISNSFKEELKNG